MSVCIIIPTYNERENLPIVVDQVFSSVPEAKILVVDDDSPDGTGKLAEDLEEKQFGRLFCLNRKGNRGYGLACLDGFRKALAQGAEIIIQMDADLSHPPSVLPKLIQMSECFDLVLGSRYIEGGSTPDWPLRRRLLSRCANLYARNILNVPVRDMTTGFRCFRRRVLEDIDFNVVQCVGYGFLTEMVCRVSRRGFSIGEIPIEFRDRTKGESKMGFSIAWEGALAVLKLRYQVMASGERVDVL